MAKRPKPKPKPDDAEQSKRFVETARELEADESGESFLDAIDAVVPPSEGEGEGEEPSERP